MCGMFTGPLSMTKKHTQILMNEVDALTEQLMPDNVLDYLVLMKRITVKEAEKLLKDQPTSHEQAKALLRLLTTKTDEDVYVLTVACKEYNMPGIAKLIEEAGTCCC